MADYGFDLRRRTKHKKKKTRAFIIAFVCFTIILGSVSTLWLWRSLNYDFNNIFAHDGETTRVETTASPDSVTYSGKYTFLIAITSDDGKTSYIFNAVTVNLDDKTIRVIPVNGDIVDSASGLTCHQLLVAGGISAVVNCLNSHYGVEFNKYIVVTETQYKSIFRAMGNITINVPEEVVYETDDMYLEIPAEQDYVLAPDKTHKYMKYIYETKEGYDRSLASAEIIVAAFQSFYTASNCENAEQIFSTVIDYCTTDISIVDFTEAQDEISYLLPDSSNERLKVFISDNITADSIEEGVV